jgi:hypothetical protein
VITIIAILVGLLLPAINQAREAANVAACKNNLKNLGLGTLNHVSTYKTLPSGGYDWVYPIKFLDGKPARTPHQGAGHFYQILPFIEQQALYEGAGGVDDTDRSNKAWAGIIPVMFCPSRREPLAMPDGWNLRYQYESEKGANDGGAQHSNNAAVRSDYRSVGAYRPNTPHCLNDYTCLRPFNTDLPNRPDANRRGAIRQWRGHNMGNILDGASNTILYTEKRVDLARINGGHGDDDQGYAVGWDQDMWRNAGKNGSNLYVPERDTLGRYVGQRSGSSHSAGVNGVMLDGSVTMFKFEIDAVVFGYLADIGDGQNVPGTAY